MTPGNERVTEPLRSLAEKSPDVSFAIVVRALVSGDDVTVAYAGVPTILAAVGAAIDVLAAESASIGRPGEGRTWTGGEAGVPFLYACLTGAHVLELDARVAADVAFEVRCDRSARRDAPAFDPRDLVGRVIAEPLASEIGDDPNGSFDCIVVLEQSYPDGAHRARVAVATYLDLVAARSGDRIARRINADAMHPYVFATMTGAQILALVELDRNAATGPNAIHQIWEDHVVRALITQSIATVKADAAQIAYSAAGKGIVWAVLDSGIDVTHPHFVAHKNLVLDALRPIRHRDFSGSQAPSTSGAGDDPGAIVDKFGHGTHVAGIIAGSWTAPTDSSSGTPDATTRPLVVRTTRNEAGADERALEAPDVIAGMAPKCTLVSLRVLDDAGEGQVSSIIDALEEIQTLNGYGRHIVVHGVNLSIGYPFDAKWFACGRSPLCIEVDRLVESGVVVVAAAGNSGYGTLSTTYTKGWPATLPQTINDPGNAECAITVGSTHRESPHLYGVSYFSSKGPTGDGRLKPDVVAPGERIISCASMQSRLPATLSQSDGSKTTVSENGYTYREDSGTSMAAPHVSGLIAAFLSIRHEYIGQPLVVKRLFVDHATDLNRDRTFQGAGLVDLMRTIAAV